MLRKPSKPYVLENFNFVNFAHTWFLKLPTIVIVFILVNPKINFNEVLLLNENALFFKLTIPKEILLVSIVISNIDLFDSFIILVDLGNLSKNYSN